MNVSTSSPADKGSKSGRRPGVVFAALAAVLLVLAILWATDGEDPMAAPTTTQVPTSTSSVPVSSDPIFQDEVIVAEGLFEGSSFDWFMTAWRSSDGTTCARLGGVGCFSIPEGGHLSGLFITEHVFPEGQPGWCGYGTVTGADSVRLDLADGTEVDATVYSTPEFDVDFFVHCQMGDSQSADVVALAADGTVLEEVPDPDADQPETPPEGFGQWTRLAEQVGFGGTGDQVISGMTAGPAGYVAVGEDEAGLPSDVRHAAVWFSRNGTQWNRIPSDGQFSDSAMSDVAWHPQSELFVAVGTHVSEGAVWVSEEGEVWERTALLGFDGPGGGIEMHAISPGGPGLVAVGMEWLSEGSSIPAVWVSADGREWIRTGDLTQFGDRAAMVDVTQHGDDLYAVGYVNETQPALWTSTDAEAWQQVALTTHIVDEATLAAIASDQTTLAITGSAPEDNPEVWTSADGRTWEPVDAISSEAGALEDVAATAQGWFAVGRDTTNTSSDVGAAVWSSVDAASWEQYPPEAPALSGGLPSAMTVLASNAEAVVAGGITGETCVERYRQCSLDVTFWLWQP